MLDDDDLKKVCDHVMETVNKHHKKSLKEFSNYKKTVKHLEIHLNRRLDYIHNKIYGPVGDFESFLDKLISVDGLVQAHTIGVQNVYNEVHKITKLIESNESIENIIKNIDPEKIKRDFIEIEEFLGSRRINKLIDDFERFKDNLCDAFNL